VLAKKVGERRTAVTLARKIDHAHPLAGLLANVLADQVEAVIVYKLDRLSRSVKCVELALLRAPGVRGDAIACRLAAKKPHQRSSWQTRLPS
jgi:hypothetical protein